MAKRKKEEKEVSQDRQVNAFSVPRENPRDLIERLQAKLGGEGVVIQRADEVEGRMDLRRPSGITSLDIACGGGVPAGGLTQIDGKEGVGKNLLLNHYFRANQRIHKDGSNIFMVCLEFNYDKLFARACGVDVAMSNYEIEVYQRGRKKEGRTLLTEAEENRLRTQVGSFTILRGSASEKLLEAVVDMVRLNSYQVGGIDSWDAMLTAADDEKDLEDHAKVADSANIQTRWMRKVQAALSPQKVCPVCGSRPLSFERHGAGVSYSCADKDACGWKGRTPYMWENETTIFGIRQVRANLNKAGMHAREYKVGGSYALQHGKLLDIQLRPGEPIKQGVNKIGKEINWELTKGKAGTHEGKKGMYVYHYSPPEIDMVLDLYNYCEAHDVIKRGPKRGTMIVEHNGKIKGMEGEISYTSKETFLRALEDSVELQNGLRTLAYIAAELGHVRFA